MFFRELHRDVSEHLQISKALCCDTQRLDIEYFALNIEANTVHYWSKSKDDECEEDSLEGLHKVLQRLENQQLKLEQSLHENKMRSETLILECPKALENLNLEDVSTLEHLAQPPMTMMVSLLNISPCNSQN